MLILVRKLLVPCQYAMKGIQRTVDHINKVRAKQ